MCDGTVVTDTHFLDINTEEYDAVVAFKYCGHVDIHGVTILPNALFEDIASNARKWKLAMRCLTILSSIGVIVINAYALAQAVTIG
jgi:hypothetical protein